MLHKCDSASTGLDGVIYLFLKRGTLFLRYPLTVQSQFYLKVTVLRHNWNITNVIRCSKNIATHHLLITLQSVSQTLLPN